MAATLPVDPFREFVEVPYDLCPPLAGWVAMTPDALEFVLRNLGERERDCKAREAAALARAKVAEAQRDATRQAAKSSGFWAENGWKIGAVVGGTVSAVITAAATYLIMTVFGQIPIGN